MENSNKYIVPVAVVLVVIVAAAAYKILNKKSSEEGEVIATASAQPSVSAGAGVYENGTYEVVGDYRSPAGPEHINVSLTLTDGVITEAEVVSPATHPTTKKMQALFIGGYRSFVIGKNIDEVELTKVSGSSLTPKGFNDAVSKIKAQASS